MMMYLIFEQEYNMRQLDFKDIDDSFKTDEEIETSINRLKLAVEALNTLLGTDTQGGEINEAEKE